jgi:hypothetical protein
MLTSVTRKALNLDDKVKAINLCDGGKSCWAVAEEIRFGNFDFHSDTIVTFTSPLSPDSVRKTM